MFLCGNHGAGDSGHHQDSFFIQRLYGMHVHHRGLNALTGQQFGCFQGFPYHVSGGDDGHIGAMPENLGPANFEFQFSGGELGYGFPSEPDINRSVHLFHRRDHCISGLCGIAG